MTDDGITLETLADEYMRMTGFTRTQVEEFLATLAMFLRCAPEELPGLVADLTASNWPRPFILVWLLVTPCLTELSAGRELLFFLAIEIAKRDGIAPELLQLLQAECQDASGVH